MLGEDDLLSYSNGNRTADTFVNSQAAKPTGIEIQPDALGFGTLAAETTPIIRGFSSENDENDLDHPVEGFSSIPEAIEDIRQGKVCRFLS